MLMSLSEKDIGITWFDCHTGQYPGNENIQTHRGLVTLYENKDHGHHWFK